MSTNVVVTCAVHFVPANDSQLLNRLMTKLII